MGQLIEVSFKHLPLRFFINTITNITTIPNTSVVTINEGAGREERQCCGSNTLFNKNVAGMLFRMFGWHT